MLLRLPASSRPVRPTSRRRAASEGGGSGSGGKDLGGGGGGAGGGNTGAPPGTPSPWWTVLQQRAVLMSAAAQKSLAEAQKSLQNGPQVKVDVDVLGPMAEQAKKQFAALPEPAQRAAPYVAVALVR